MRSLSALLFIVVSLDTVSCGGCKPLDRIAQGYVELVEGMERSEGSPAIARTLVEELERLPTSGRALHLKRQLEALTTRLEIREGRRLPFDEESRLLFDVVAPQPEEGAAARIRAELDGLLEGDGPLATRYAKFQRRFIVPSDRIDTVLREAIDECRRRTRLHLALPPEESVRIEYVSGKPWISFCSYRGAYRSVIEIDREVPLTIAGALTIASHEAYPGHHTASVLLEEGLVRGRGRIEFSVEPLVGPEALIREGLAQYATRLVFPRDERRRFEKDVLFPLARISAEDVDRYDRVEELVHRLAPLAVEGARQYIDGKRDRVASAIWLENEALIPDSWAFLRFVDQYRSYVLAYTQGDDMVRDALSREASDPWVAYSRLLSFPDDAS